MQEDGHFSFSPLHYVVVHIHMRIHVLSLLFESKAKDMIEVILGIIRPNSLDMVPKLIFNNGTKIRQNCTNIRFVFEQKNPCNSSTIINE